MAPLEFEPQLKRIEKLSAKHGGLHDFLAVFDLGSRASRLLVGPKDPARLLEKHFVASVSTETFLGQSKSPTTHEIALDARLEQVTRFLGRMADGLRSFGLQPDNIRVIGTAVFRGVANEAAVLSFIRERTGLSVEIIDELYEARLGLLSVWVNFKNHRAIREGDFILLVDQGGGSTELAYARFSKNQAPSRETIAARSFNIGTLNLVARATPADAETMQTDLPAERVRLLTNESMHSLSEFATALHGKRVHCFGMGSAITKMARGNVWQINGCIISYSALRHRTERLALLTSQDGSKGGQIDLTQLYGLPVYTKVLDELKLGKISICGFGLRFGALYENVMGFSLR